MAKERPLRILVSAGEPSGDNYAARLVRELRRLDPSCEIEGYAGPKAQEAGLRMVENLLRYSVMGIVPVLLRAGSLLRLIGRIKRHLAAYQPDVVVPIDYPGLHFLLAKWARARGSKVAYYVSPQLWAWAEWRIRKVKARVDRMLVILPFEKSFYARHGVEVTFVGHPLFDYLDDLDTDATLVEALREGRTGPVIAIFPGSREQEIRRNLPLQLEAARQLRDLSEEATFVVTNPGHDGKLVALLEEGVERGRFPGLHLLLGSPYDVMAAADLALVTSGTATIELTYYCVPMIVTYKTGALTAIVGRRITKTRHIGLVNILGGKEVAPEFFTHRDCSGEIVERALELLPGGRKREETVAELSRIRGEMGGPGASERAARVILELARSPPRS